MTLLDPKTLEEANEQKQKEMLAEVNYIKSMKMAAEQPFSAALNCIDWVRHYTAQYRSRHLIYRELRTLHRIGLVPQFFIVFLQVKPTATRNVILIRHGQYQMETKDKFLTPLVMFFCVFV